MNQSATFATRDHATKRQGLPESTGAAPRPDIFDTLDFWLTSPELAYSSWVAGQSLKDSTKQVYIFMFGRFCQWLITQGKRLDQVEAGDIRKFLDSANPNLPESRKDRTNSGRQRQQYVRQLEKVFSHLGTLNLRGITNPGRIAGYERVGSGSDKPTRFLIGRDAEAVIRLIQTRLDELRREEKGIDEWMEFRDLALIGVMIGGGLKVSHIGALTLSCIDLTEERIDLSKPGFAHRARLLPFAVAALKAWLDVQRDLHAGKLSPTQKIFEADRKSGFGRTSKTVTLSASSIHRRTNALLKLAGITGDRASAQTLRNSYAGLLIEGGATDEHLVDYLGLQASVTAQRLRAAYQKARAGQSDSPADPD